MTHYIAITTISLSGVLLLNYFYASIKDTLIKMLNDTSLTSRIKVLEDEIQELRECLDGLEEKVGDLELKLQTKEIEKNELHQSNIDLSNKLDSFITYNYEVL
jgi:chromosome segregation ATPase